MTALDPTLATAAPIVDTSPAGPVAATSVVEGGLFGLIRRPGETRGEEVNVTITLFLWSDGTASINVFRPGSPYAQAQVPLGSGVATLCDAMATLADEERAERVAAYGRPPLTVKRRA
jgi:hypothetical protein